MNFIRSCIFIFISYIFFMLLLFKSLICNCNTSFLQLVEVQGCRTVPLFLALSTGSVLYILYFPQSLLKFPLWKTSMNLFARDLYLTKQASHKSRWPSPSIIGYYMAGTYADCFSLMNCSLQSLKRLGFIITMYLSFSGVNSRLLSISRSLKMEKIYLLQWYATYLSLSLPQCYLFLF